MGIPVIGCECEVCLSKSLFNRRSRPGGLITIEDKKILIDASQDFRCQALKHEINKIDGVIITHAHHDHTAGIDDLRPYCIGNEKFLPLLLSKETHEELKTRYAYIFNPLRTYSNLLPRFDIQILESLQGNTVFAGLSVRFMSFTQANMLVNGFRFGEFAFLSDIKEYSESIFDQLKGVQTLVISALRFTPSALHFTVDEAVAFARKVGASKTWFTHICHDLDHEKGNAYLPSDIRLAYDGLQIPFHYFE